MWPIILAPQGEQSVYAWVVPGNCGEGGQRPYDGFFRPHAAVRETAGLGQVEFPWRLRSTEGRKLLEFRKIIFKLHPGSLAADVGMKVGLELKGSIQDIQSHAEKAAVLR